MEKIKEVKLPSGAILKIRPAPFSDAKALYQAILKEGRGVSFTSKGDVGQLVKDIFCTAFSSPEIEAKLEECMKRCTIQTGSADLKIDADTFEPLERRQDYLTVCMEVTAENVGPFTKSLFAEYQRVFAMIEKSPA